MKAHKKRSRSGDRSSTTHHIGQKVESNSLPAETLPAQLRNLSEMFDLALAHVPQMLARTWAEVFDSVPKESCCDGTRRRLESIRKDKRLEKFWMWKVVETRPDELVTLLNKTGLSTSLLLRRIVNHALDTNCLPFPMLLETEWSRILAEQRRAIIRDRYSKFAARQLAHKGGVSL